MAKDKTPGIILYPEDIERIKRSVKPEYQFAVIYALAQFATTGELPTEAELGEGGMVAFEFIFDKVSEALQKYQETSEKRKSAVNARWGTNESRNIQTDTSDTNEYKSIQMNSNVTKTETETETEIEKKSINVKPKEVAVVDNAPAPATDNVIAFDGSDLTADIRNNQKAQELAARYLPRGRTPMEFDPRVGALAEDIGTHGAEKVEAALKEAARCDNRGGVSIAFYRTILGNLGKEKPPNKAAAGDYQHRQYTEADFKAMEVDLDAL